MVVLRDSESSRRQRQQYGVCIALGLLSIVPIEFFRGIESDCFVVISNCAFWLVFSMPSQTSKVMRARIVWSQRKRPIQIFDRVVVVTFLTIKQASFTISISMLGIERDRMTELHDLSVEIGENDLPFVLPRWHLLSNLIRARFAALLLRPRFFSRLISSMLKVGSRYQA
jgi:hypothetical protein